MRGATRCRRRGRGPRGPSAAPRARGRRAHRVLYYYAGWSFPTRGPAAAPELTCYYWYCWYLYCSRLEGCIIINQGTPNKRRHKLLRSFFQPAIIVILRRTNPGFSRRGTVRIPRVPLVHSPLIAFVVAQILPSTPKRLHPQRRAAPRRTPKIRRVARFAMASLPVQSLTRGVTVSSLSTRT